MRLNGHSVRGRFNDTVVRCIVSPAITRQFVSEVHPTRAVVQADFCGMGFTAEVPVDVGDIEANLVVGHEWISLFCVVVGDPPVSVRDTRDFVLPSCIEEFSPNSVPLHGSAPLPFADRRVDQTRSPATNAGLSDDTVRMIETVLHSDMPMSSAWTIFHSDVEVLRRCCCSSPRASLRHNAESMYYTLNRRTQGKSARWPQVCFHQCYPHDQKSTTTIGIGGT